MRDFWISPPRDTARYVLANVNVPPALCDLTPRGDGWCNANILIENGTIEAVIDNTSTAMPNVQSIDADRSVLLSGLVDCHTHLDKAHVAAFAAFEPGDLASAINAMIENKATWTRENLAKRVDFSLKSAFAYGVRAMRSHVDFSLNRPDFIPQTLQEAQRRWRGKIDLQLSPLAEITKFEDAAFRRAIFDVAEEQGRVGAFLFRQNDLVDRLTPIFERAKSSGWDLDFHVDEGLDPKLNGLEAVAQVALMTNFTGTVLCGHCVALNSYTRDRRERVIALARQAGLHFVSLPTSNLYLQSRGIDGGPKYRGMAPVSRLSAMGATVSLGADNVQDGFCAFGDFDPMSVLNLGAQVGHLHEPARDWAALVTINPATSMGLKWDGRIVAGSPADLVLLSARNSNELNLRGAAKRIVIRGGEWLTPNLPAFSELTN